MYDIVLLTTTFFVKGITLRKAVFQLLGWFS